MDSITLGWRPFVLVSCQSTCAVFSVAIAVICTSLFNREDVGSVAGLEISLSLETPDLRDEEFSKLFESLYLFAVLSSVVVESSLALSPVGSHLGRRVEEVIVGLFSFEITDAETRSFMRATSHLLYQSSGSCLEVLSASR